MGDIIGPALLVLVVILAIGAWFSFSRSSTKQRRDLIKAPALLLPDGEPPDVLLANARANFLLAQRSARLLDRILNSKTTTLDKADAKEADAIVKAFFN